MDNLELCLRHPERMPLTLREVIGETEQNGRRGSWRSKLTVFFDQIHFRSGLREASSERSVLRARPEHRWTRYSPGF